MVTTRRSVFPTIPVARALRRERRARIAEAEILPSQIIASRTTSGQQSKSGDASQKSRKKNKKKAERQTLPISLDSVPQINLSQVECNSVPQINLSQVECNSVPQINLSQVEVPQINLSQVEVSQINASQVPPPSTQASVQLPSPDASQNPPAGSQHQEAWEPWLIRKSTPLPHLNLSQDSLSYPNTQVTIQPPSPGGSQSPPGPSQPQEEVQFNLSQSCSSSLATIQPAALDGSQNPPPCSAPDESQNPLPSSAPEGSQNPHPSHPREAEKFWFGLAPNAQGALPKPITPIFRPGESLVHFATGVPVVEETKPFDHGHKNDNRNDGFFIASDDPEVIAAHSARRREAIAKAATAVMAHMDGHDVARSDYLSILDVQLADPDMRDRLPPVLFERYALAVKEKPSTLYNGGLIDKFINATKRATNVTARILLNSKNAKRERRARGARGRPYQAQSSANLSSIQQYYSQMVPDPTHASNKPAPTPQRAQQPVPRLFPEPLTQANLNRAPDHLIKGKAKEAPGLWDEERGVMRTAKGLVRAAPYPRRASSDVLRVTCALAGSSGNKQNKESHDECNCSVYSASTGLLHQQAEAKKVANSMLDGVKNMFDLDSHDAQCVRAAEAVIEETKRTKGAQEAANIRRGFDLLHCYDIVKHLNVDLLSHALLEHISETPKPPISQVDAQLTPQLREHPQLGWGYHSYAPVFQPIGSSQPYTEPIRPPLP